MSTTAVAAEPRARVLLRPLAIPNEHGGWGFLLEPIVLALIVAPSAAGALVALAALGTFLARHPCKLAASDWLRHRRYPRTRACEEIAAAYAGAALIALALAIRFGGWQLVLPLAAAAPLGLIQFALDARNRGRAVLPELAGAIAMGSVAASMAIGGAKPLPLAAALWLFTICRAVPAIVYVRALLGRGRGAIAVHVAAIAVVALLWRASLAPLVAVVAMVALLARAVIGLRSRSKPQPKRIGITELVWGGVTGIATAIGYVL